MITTLSSGDASYTAEVDSEIPIFHHWVIRTTSFLVAENLPSTDMIHRCQFEPGEECINTAMHKHLAEFKKSDVIGRENELRTISATVEKMHVLYDFELGNDTIAEIEAIKDDAA